MASPSPTLFILPNELIHNICCHLPFSDLLRFLSSCRHIYDLLIHDASLWKAVQYQLIFSKEPNKGLVQLYAQMHSPIDPNPNVTRVNALMHSPLLPFCTRLRVVKNSRKETSELQCIPEVFFTNLLPAVSHQLKELCLLHNYSRNESTCSRYNFNFNCFYFCDILVFY